MYKHIYLFQAFQQRELYSAHPNWTARASPCREQRELWRVGSPGEGVAEEEQEGADGQGQGGGDADANQQQPAQAPPPPPQQPEQTPRQKPERRQQEITRSIWSISHDYVRKGMQKAVLGTALLLPPLALTGYAANKVAERTPVVKNVYEPTRDAMKKVLIDTPIDITSRVVTAPTSIIDRVEDAYEVATNTVQFESKGIGRFFEGAWQGSLNGIKGLATLTGKALSTLLKGASLTLNALWAPVKVVGGTWVKAMTTAPVATSLVTIGLLGGLAAVGPAGVAEQLWTLGTGLLEGVGSWFSSGAGT